MRSDAVNQRVSCIEVVYDLHNASGRQCVLTLKDELDKFLQVSLPFSCLLSDILTELLYGGFSVENDYPTKKYFSQVTVRLRPSFQYRVACSRTNFSVYYARIQRLDTVPLP